MLLYRNTFFIKLQAHVFCCIFAALVVTATARAEEVTQPFKGLTLNANLELAPGKSLEEGVILITHAGLATRSMELYVYLQRLLQERGYNTLAINLSLGLDNRHGMYDCKVTHKHRYADGAEEIGAWVDWLKRQGVKRVVLLGHSRGGAETALYAAEHDEPLVRAVILLAPDTRETNDAAVYKKITTNRSPLWSRRHKT